MPDTLSQLESYDWPGNIRELENVIERSIILSQEELIQDVDLPTTEAEKESGSVLDKEISYSNRLDAFSRKVLLNALEKHNWNQSAAAKYLGLHRNTLLSKMEKLGIRKD